MARSVCPVAWAMSRTLLPSANDRHPSLRPRQLQGPGHQVGVDTTLAPRLDDQHQRRNVPRAVVRLRNAHWLDVHHERGQHGRAAEQHRPADRGRAGGRQRVSHQPLETGLVGRRTSAQRPVPVRQAIAVPQDAESFDSAAGARQAALSECSSRGGGSGCTVRVWGCNGPVVEEELGLNQAARRQIQQGLRANGFDPGGADGLFGPRTRAAIRSWQSARGARSTGIWTARRSRRCAAVAAPRLRPGAADSGDWNRLLEMDAEPEGHDGQQSGAQLVVADVGIEQHGAEPAVALNDAAARRDPFPISSG